MRASVGSTEAAKDVVARFGVIDRSIQDVSSRLDMLCTFVTLDSSTVTARELADYLHGAPEVIEKYLDCKIEEAKAFVASPMNWLLIEPVAAALIERQTLSARQVKKICREALLRM